jgi:hypothetical protein
LRDTTGPDAMPGEEEQWQGSKLSCNANLLTENRNMD